MISASGIASCPAHNAVPPTVRYTVRVAPVGITGKVDVAVIRGRVLIGGRGGVAEVAGVGVQTITTDGGENCAITITTMMPAAIPLIKGLCKTR